MMMDSAVTRDDGDPLPSDGGGCRYPVMTLLGDRYGGDRGGQLNSPLR